MIRRALHFVLALTLATAPSFGAQIGGIPGPKGNPAPRPQSATADPIVGKWQGTGEEELDDGRTTRYPVTITIAKQGTGYTARVEADLTLPDESGRTFQVRYLGDFAGQFQNPSLQLASRKLELVVVQTNERIPMPPQQIIASLQGGTLAGRAGSADEGWASFRCTKVNASGGTDRPKVNRPKISGPVIDGPPKNGPVVEDSIDGGRTDRPRVRNLPQSNLSPPLDASYQALFANVPNVRNLTPPASLRPGTRLTFWLGVADVMGAAGQSTMTRDPNGRIYDEQGNRYSMSQVGTGSGAAGYTHVDVIAVTARAVVMDIRQYNGDGTATQPSPGDVNSFVSHSSGCEYWIHPQVLAQLRPGDHGGLRVMRGQYQHNGRMYQTVMILSKTPNSSFTNVYDTETGFNLSMSATMKSNKTRTHVDPQTGRYGPQTTTDSTLVVSTLSAARDLNLPWANAPLVPENVGQTLQYQGAQALDMGVGAQNSTPFRVSITPRTTDAAVNVYDVSVEMPGAPNGPFRLQRYGAAAQLGCILLSPQALAQLRPGQEIDRDPVTGYRTFVEHVGPNQQGRNVAVITTSGAGGMRRWIYDTQSGRLIEEITQQRFGQPATVTTTTTRLVTR